MAIFLCIHKAMELAEGLSGFKEEGDIGGPRTPRPSFYTSTPRVTPQRRLLDAPPPPCNSPRLLSTKYPAQPLEAWGVWDTHKCTFGWRYGDLESESMSTSAWSPLPYWYMTHIEQLLSGSVVSMIIACNWISMFLQCPAFLFDLQARGVWHLFHTLQSNQDKRMLIWIMNSLKCPGKESVNSTRTHPLLRFITLLEWWNISKNLSIGLRVQELWGAKLNKSEWKMEREKNIISEFTTWRVEVLFVAITFCFVFQLFFPFILGWQLVCLW